MFEESDSDLRHKVIKHLCSDDISPARAGSLVVGGSFQTPRLRTGLPYFARHSGLVVYSWYERQEQFGLSRSAR